ncbi:hypothetical protein LTR80_008850 [Exophiala xenobiotica]
MTSLSKKRKSSSVVRDDSDVDAAVATKRGKGASGAAFIPSNKPQTDSDGNQYWEISRGRRVTISDYKGMTLVNIREYYQRDSEWLPGKKYSALIDAVPQIELLLQKQGEKVSQPKYDGSAPVEDDQPQEDEDTDKKANIEATSDEEE